MASWTEWSVPYTSTLMVPGGLRIVLRNTNLNRHPTQYAFCPPYIAASSSLAETYALSRFLLDTLQAIQRITSQRSFIRSSIQLPQETIISLIFLRFVTFLVSHTWYSKRSSPKTTPILIAYTTLPRTTALFGNAKQRSGYFDSGAKPQYLAECLVCIGDALSNKCQPGSYVCVQSEGPCACMSALKPTLQCSTVFLYL